MVNRNLLRQFDLPEEMQQREWEVTTGGESGDWLPAELQDFQDNRIITGLVRRVSGDTVWVDIGYKTEGAIELREWFDEGLGQIVSPESGAVGLLLVLPSLGLQCW